MTARDATITSLTQQLADCQAAATKPPVTTARYPGDPGFDKTLMMSSNEGGDPVPEETFFKTHLQGFRFYSMAGDDISKLANRAKADAAAGRVLVWSQKVPSTDWAGVAKGTYDGWLRQRFDVVAASGKPVIHITHHEPENDINATTTEAVYAAMQKHVAGLLKDYPTIGYSTAAQGSWYNPNLSGNKQNLSKMYPDGSIYDVFGFDQYEQFFAGGSIKHHTVAQLIGADVTTFRAYFGKAKPMALWEHGVRVDPAKPGYAADWLNTLYAYARTVDLDFVSYFFSSQNSPNGSWAFQDPKDERYVPMQTAFNTSAVALG